jgi:hypothetical protein
VPDSLASTVRPTTAWRSLRVVAVLCASALALVCGPLALTAHAQGTASTFVVDANLAKDGTLRVKQTITFSGPAPAQLSQRLETRENLLGNRQYEQTISEISATAKGATVTPDVKPGDGFTTCPPTAPPSW